MATQAKTVRASKVLNAGKVIAVPASADIPTFKMDSDDVLNFAGTAVNAFKAAARGEARVAATLLESVVESAGYIGKALTASEYSRVVGKETLRQFKRAVDQNRLTAGTASVRRSQLKTSVLAILANLATPAEGEGFVSFVERAGDALKGAKLADGRLIRDEATGGKPRKPDQRGGTGSKGGGRRAGAGVVAATVVATEEPRDVVMQRAALVLTEGNPTRAAKLVVVLTNFAAEFDKWTATILTEQSSVRLVAQTA